jgi:hypothetical protein
MSGITLALVIFGIMLFFMVIRTPITISMFIAGTVGFLYQSGWPALSNFLNTQTFARFARMLDAMVEAQSLMDDIVKQAMAKWPNVPACHGWLGLDARGHW